MLHISELSNFHDKFFYINLCIEKKEGTFFDEL